MTKHHRPNRGGETNLWDMLRDVLQTSINKGQFPVAILGLIIIVCVIRMPSEDVSQFAFDLKSELLAGYYWGYIIATVALWGWWKHTRWQRKIISNELKRIGLEKSRYQGQQIGTIVVSSEE